MLVRPAAPLILLGTFGLALLQACSLPDVMVDGPPEESSSSDNQTADRDAAALNDAGIDDATVVQRDASAPPEAKPGAKDAKDAEEVTPKPEAGGHDAETPRDASTTMPPMDAAMAPLPSEDDAGPETDIGNIFAAWPMPDAFPGSQTGPSYGTRANVVIDSITRLEWQAQLPKVYPGCTGMHPNGMQGDCCTWLEAAAYCKSYGEQFGQTGWRLPTKIELESIVDETKYAPAIDTFYFPETPIHAFWTSTSFTGLADNAYYVGFGTGVSSFTETKSKADVRCVR
jgi:hypothetical protein